MQTLRRIEPKLEMWRAQRAPSFGVTKRIYTFVTIRYQKWVFLGNSSTNFADSRTCRRHSEARSKLVSLSAYMKQGGCI